MTDEEFQKYKSQIDEDTLNGVLEKYKEKYDAEGLSQDEREKRILGLIARFSMR